ncbi:MAG: hypothetical protein AAFV59_14980 [Pseudomonadota bacterium]
MAFDDRLSFYGTFVSSARGAPGGKRTNEIDRLIIDSTIISPSLDHEGELREALSYVKPTPADPELRHMVVITFPIEMETFNDTTVEDRHEIPSKDRHMYQVPETDDLIELFKKFDRGLNYVE